MMKRLVLLTLLLFVFARPSYAIYNPLSVSNNRFGMHIIDENDLSDAENLVNSSGGDWGYAKLVIREDDRKLEKWQNIFDRMRSLHLIPVVRLATKIEHGVWAKPRQEDVGSWVDFLSSLNWVIKNRYVIIFNEPNHAGEWGGDINPEEYAWFLDEFATRLKEKSDDFFVLPAGLDASAPNGIDTMNEADFIEAMVAEKVDVFKKIDGWTSHSYPNPDFSGNPGAFGRGTVRTFQWERELLGKYGVGNLPIFIAETGWKHSEGKRLDYAYATTTKVAQNYVSAFSYAWQDPQIVAVFPFLLNYQDEPFDHFSWKKIGSDEFYPIYSEVAQLPKTTGKPQQIDQARFLPALFPRSLVTDSNYTLYLEMENTGQSLISTADGWHLRLLGLDSSFSVAVSDIEPVAPFHRTRFEIKLKTPANPGVYPYSFVLEHDDKVITTQKEQVVLIPPPSALVYAKQWINHLAEGTDYTLLIYDDKENLIEQRNIVFSQGYADVENLHNIVPDMTYRFVLSKPYYLPRQTHAILNQSKTGIAFETLLPLDPSNDGALGFADMEALWRHPLQTLSRLLAL